jgi:hypothetical protein
MNSPFVASCLLVLTVNKYFVTIRTSEFPLLRFFPKRLELVYLVTLIRLQGNNDAMTGGNERLENYN